MDGNYIIFISFLLELGYHHIYANSDILTFCEVLNYISSTNVTQSKIEQYMA
jgi:hypothetical protein